MRTPRFSLLLALSVATGAGFILRSSGVKSQATPPTVVYSYDERGRLKSAVYDTGAAVRYSYDAANNRLSKTTTTP